MDGWTDRLPTSNFGGDSPLPVPPKSPPNESADDCRDAKQAPPNEKVWTL